MRLGLALAALLAAPPGLPDSDGDGIPDSAELTSEGDRAAFRRWFVAVALAQADHASPRWNPAERDCAGFVRFALREALRGDGEALNGAAPPGPPVAAYRFPSVPGLGENLFLAPEETRAPGRIRFGAARVRVPFASARVLAEHNSHRVSRL